MSVVFAAVLAVCAIEPRGYAQAAPAKAQIQSHSQAQMQVMALVSVTCTANPVSVFTGGIVTLQAQGKSVQGLPLHYAFTTDTGKLTVDGALAKLNTAGLGPRTAHVTCTAIDSADRSASQVVEVKILGVPQTEKLHIPSSGVSGAVIKPQPAPAPPVTAAVTLPSAPKPSPDHTSSSGAKEAQAAKIDQQERQEQELQQMKQQQEEKKQAPKKDGSASAAASSPPAPAPVSPDKVNNEISEVTVPVPVPPAPETAQPAVPDEYRQSKAVADWVSHLKQGKIEYQVPSTMLLQQAANVTVVIHGFEDVTTTTLPQATGSDTLKQSERMKVGLLADGDAFTITSQDADPIKFVPINGISTWTWKVTPNKSGAKQPLEIIVWLVYPNADKTEQQVEDYKTTVEVDVPSVWSTIADNYQHDPTKFFSYMIPGGAGFTFLAGLAVWWWKRRHKDEKD